MCLKFRSKSVEDSENSDEDLPSLGACKCMPIYWNVYSVQLFIIVCTVYDVLI